MYTRMEAYSYMYTLSEFPPSLERQMSLWAHSISFPLIYISCYCLFSTFFLAQSRYELDGQRLGDRVPVEAIFSPSSSRPFPELTQPPIHWETETLSSGLRLSRREADHSRVVSRSRIYGSINALPHTSSWRCA
jgi:hypothetical protein